MAEPLVALLAAGRGSRFGGGKLEAECAGKPLGRWALEAVGKAGLKPGVVVTGPEAASFAEGWRILVNREPEAGLGSSLGLAAHAAFEAGEEALLVLLADMPLVDPGYLRALASTAAPAATRQPDGRAGVPALLDRRLIGAAMALSGDRGAGPLLAGATMLDAPAGTLRDVDTGEDLAEVARVLRQAQDERLG